MPIMGILISHKLNIIQRLDIASILSGISQALVITAARENLIANLDANLDSTNNDLQKQINELKKHIKKLEDGKNI
jgi:cell division protein FtsB